MTRLTVGVVGNPNCGKTTLFNALTGARQQVGNWPGVTVDRKVGHYSWQGVDVELVDTPGIYSLSASSLDEEVTRNFVLSREAALIVNIVDASNIERNLYLTAQLLEMQAKVLVALNMMDMAALRGLDIDVEELSRRLGCPVVPMSASQGKGIDDLRSAVASFADNALAFSPVPAEYPGSVQEAQRLLAGELAAEQSLGRMPLDWVALKLLEGEAAPVPGFTLNSRLAPVVAAQRQYIETREEEDCDIVIASARYAFISRLTEGVIKRRGEANASLTEKIDRFALSRIWGIPLFLVAMYLTFMITINVGNVFIDFFDQLFATVFVNGFKELLATLHAPAWLQVVLANGVGGGIQTISTFVPPIFFMFLCLSFLEDSGYMARAAFVMDRFMRVIGLPGKAFVPMLVGFGCNVPAIMATRTLESQRDRFMTISMNPFMSCGARLPVYALFAAAFFPRGGQNIVFLIYLIGVAMAVFTGLVLKHTLLRGEATPFVMELPPYHLPSWKAVGLRTYERVMAFIKRAGKIIIPIILILAFLNSLGTDGSFGNEDTKNSVLSEISQKIVPAVRPIGVTEENWPGVVGLFTGIFAKEAVIGTINSLYAGMAENDGASGGEAAEEEEPFSFWGGIRGALATIPEKARELGGTFLDPLGIAVDTNEKDAAEKLEVDASVFTVMRSLFDGKAGAFAYMLFVLMYAPCVAALSAVYRETTLRWTVFVAFWNTMLAFVVASSFYQIMTFRQHPGYSTTVLLSAWGLFFCVLLAMHIRGSKTAQDVAELARAVPVS